MTEANRYEFRCSAALPDAQSHYPFRFTGAIEITNLKTIFSTLLVWLWVVCTSAGQELSTVQFVSSSYSVSEFAGFVRITVERIGEPGGTAYVQYRTVDGTARSGEDYKAEGGSLWFSGETNLTLYIPLLHDTNYEARETFTVELTWARSSDTRLGMRTNCVVTIDDRLGDDRLDEWTWAVRDANTTKDLHGVIYANGLFTAVGDGGIILTSTDGRDWQTAAIVTSDSLRGVAYGTNRFVAVGSNGSILTSLDGMTWSQEQSTATNLFGVTYGAGLFVAVGICANIVVSLDGQSWDLVGVDDCDLGAGSVLQSVTYGNGKFVAAGFFFNEQVSPVGTVQVSADGTNWMREFCCGYTLDDIAFGNGIFVAAGRSETPRVGIHFTTKGTEWSTQPYAGPDGLRRFQGIAYGADTFIAVGIEPRNDPWTPSIAAIAMPDSLGIWRSRELEAVPPLRSVAFGNGTFVAVGDRGAVIQAEPVVRLAIEFAELPTLTVAAPAGSYRIEAAEQFGETIAWKSLATICVTNGPQAWTDSQATNSKQRFYRAVSLP